MTLAVLVFSQASQTSLYLGLHLPALRLETFTIMSMAQYFLKCKYILQNVQKKRSTYTFSSSWY